MVTWSRPTRKGCPCCSFDLFLPDSLKQSDNSGPETDAEVSDSTTQNDIDEPCTPQEVLGVLLQQQNDSPIPRYTLVDTHGHAQLDRDRDESYLVSDELEGVDQIQLKSIVCAVQPNDWLATLEMASKSNQVLPALGIHPWYLEDRLPIGWLETMEQLLLEHPGAIVGEIGLCKMARWTRHYADGKAAALEIQREVFRQQLQLAAKLRRPVSVHCVNQHGVFKSVLEEVIQQARSEGKRAIDALPPKIAMHSFTGTAHQAKELIAMEQGFVDDQAEFPVFYFGFSHTVNYVMNTSTKARRKGRDAVKSIPSNRLLVESDVHAESDLLAGTAGAIGYVAWARSETIQDVTETTAKNGMTFLSLSM